MVTHTLRHVRAAEVDRRGLEDEEERGIVGGDLELVHVARHVVADSRDDVYQVEAGVQRVEAAMVVLVARPEGDIIVLFPPLHLHIHGAVSERIIGSHQTSLEIDNG